MSRACLNGDLEEVKYLISVGADVNYKNGCALFRAFEARNNKFEICKILIEAGIIVNYINENTGNTPLHRACYKNDLNI